VLNLLGDSYTSALESIPARTSRQSKKRIKKILTIETDIALGLNLMIRSGVCEDRHGSSEWSGKV
jgi:hypothetical protein